MLDALLDHAANTGLAEVVIGHGAPRPAERAREHHREAATGRSSRSSRAPSTRTRSQGSGDVKYHLGCGRASTRSGGNDSVSSSRRTRATSRPWIRSSRAWPARSRTCSEPPESARGAPGADPRRRGVRRTGRRSRDAEPLPAQRLSRRRHDPRRRQQPDRLHYGARGTGARRVTRPTSRRWCRRRSCT